MYTNNPLPLRRLKQKNHEQHSARQIQHQLLTNLRSQGALPPICQPLPRATRGSRSEFISRRLRAITCRSFNFFCNKKKSVTPRYGSSSFPWNKHEWCAWGNTAHSKVRVGGSFLQLQFQPTWVSQHHLQNIYLIHQMSVYTLLSFKS